jgi:hypothetical protein
MLHDRANYSRSLKKLSDKKIHETSILLKQREEKVELIKAEREALAAAEREKEVNF